VTSELMTADLEPETAAPPLTASVGPAARAHLVAALGLLVVAAVLGALAAADLVLPDLFAGIGPLGYGRLLPAATDLFLFGWLTIGLFGAIYLIIPRVTGVPLRSPMLAMAGGGLLLVAYVGGAVAVALGANEGRQYLEFPLWADAVAVVGLLAATRSITATITARAGGALGPVEWYLGAAPVWLLLTTVAGNLPGIGGVVGTVQAAFHHGALFGLWFAAAGVGVVYYLVGALFGTDPQPPSRLAAIGFWSLGFVWALTGLSGITYSAVADWVETTGVLFAIALLLPVVVIFTDVVTLMRGRWSHVVDRTAMRLVMAGAALFAAIPVVNLAPAVRASNAVVGFTSWAGAVDWVAAYGAFTCWLLALLHHAAPSMRGGAVGRRSGWWHYRLTLVGVVVVAAAMLGGGLQAGLGWVANANSQVVSAGPEFRTTVEGLRGWYWVRFGGIAVFALAQLWFAVAWWRAPRGQRASSPVDQPGGDGAAPAPAAGAVAAEDRPIALGRLRLGVLGLFAVAVLFGLVAPAVDAAAVSSTRLADTARRHDADPAVERGFRLYIAEGCWYCHTQEVRQIVTDVGLGPVSAAGDYVWEQPAPRGVERIGPDLFHTGHSPTSSVQQLVGVLEAPRARQSWSIMPSYEHLSNVERQELALYLASLE
jgi:cbb3-type cytochrome oxidase subunit 1